MPRKDYKLELDVTVSLDDEKLDDVGELLKARVSEMLGRMEQKDDVRILLVHDCSVTEVK